MSVIDEIKPELHMMRVKLYHNYLPGKEGELIARTDSEKILSVAKVCKAADEKGEYTGSFDDFVEHTNIFLKEAAYQLCDGFAVDFGGLFVAYPNVGGVFENEHDPVDKQKHKITFRFRTLSGLRRLVEKIEVICEGLADVSGYIAEFTDVTTGAVNEEFTPGGQFILTGHKIKVDGSDPSIGVYFVDDDGYEAKVDVHLAENTSTKLIGVLPILAAKPWTIVVKTQFSGSVTRPLKEVRAVRSAFTIRRV